MRLLTFLAATALAAGTLAGPSTHRHKHLRRHAHHAHARHAIRSPSAGADADAGAATATACPVEVETVYELDGQLISEKEAKRGLQNGNYGVAGESQPVSEIRDQYDDDEEEEEEDEEPEAGATFYETKHRADERPAGDYNETETETDASDSAGTGDSYDADGETSSSGSGSTYSGTGGGSGLDADFPSGQIPCSTFPSEYGAVAIDWLGTGGWAGVQKCPGYRKGNLISFIETAVRGGGCDRQSFCSYACPVGYQKTQWPSDQGATGQSIGGLYCNADGMLELSRPAKTRLCEPGAGGVTVQNDLGVRVSSCRTDYPGTESMVIPCVAEPGQGGIPLANPYSPDYYQWEGKPTTAQWYVNKKGLAPEQACVWDSDEDHDARGNWAPVNIGVGKNQDGLTFISIFPNKPTSSADLDYNIEIVGDVNAECKLENGVYTGGGDGCTTAIKDGQSAVIRFYS